MRWIPNIGHHIRCHAIWTPVVLWSARFYSIHQQHRAAGLFERSFFVPTSMPQIRLLHHDQRDPHCHHPHRLHHGRPGLCAPGSRLHSHRGHVPPDSLPLSQLPGRCVWPGPHCAALCHRGPLLLRPGAGGCYRGQREAQAEDRRSEGSRSPCCSVWPPVHCTHTH